MAGVLRLACLRQASSGQATGLDWKEEKALPVVGACHASGRQAPGKPLGWTGVAGARSSGRVCRGREWRSLEWWTELSSRIVSEPPGSRLGVNKDGNKGSSALRLTHGLVEKPTTKARIKGAPDAASFDGPRISRHASTGQAFVAATKAKTLTGQVSGV